MPEPRSEKKNHREIVLHILKNTFTVAFKHGWKFCEEICDTSQPNIIIIEATWQKCWNNGNVMNDLKHSIPENGFIWVYYNLNLLYVPFSCPSWIFLLLRDLLEINLFILFFGNDLKWTCSFWEKMSSELDVGTMRLTYRLFSRWIQSIQFSVFRSHVDISYNLLYLRRIATIVIPKYIMHTLGFWYCCDDICDKITMVIKNKY